MDVDSRVDSDPTILCTGFGPKNMFITEKILSPVFGVWEAVSDPTLDPLDPTTPASRIPLLPSLFLRVSLVPLRPRPFSHSTRSRGRRD